jgi:hypothetical protein
MFRGRRALIWKMESISNAQDNGAPMSESSGVHRRIRHAKVRAPDRHLSVRFSWLRGQ